MLTERRPGTIGILGSWSGFTDSARRRAESAHDVILFDRPHLEALISGAASGPELIAAANRSISVLGHSETPLSVLLRPRRADAEPLWLGPPDGFTPAAVAAPDGLDATIVAHGPTIAGITAHGDRLLVTVVDGTMDLAAHRRSTPRRHLELTGCVGTPLVTPIGDLFVVRNGRGAARYW